MKWLRILGRAVTLVMLGLGAFLILVAAFYGGGSERANLVGSVGGCLFWLAIIFDRRLRTPKVASPEEREDDSAAPAPSLKAS